MPRKTYSKAGNTVTIEHDGSILVKPGDWLSKYSLAIHGDVSHLNEYLRMIGDVLHLVNDVDNISAGETLYHLPSMPRGENRPVLVPVPGGGVPSTIGEIEKILKEAGLKPTDWGWDTLMTMALKFGVTSLGFLGQFSATAGAGVVGAVGVPLVAILGGCYTFNKMLKAGYVQIGMRGVTYGAVAWIFGHPVPQLPNAVEQSIRNNAAMHDSEAELVKYRTHWQAKVIESQNALVSHFLKAGIPIAEAKKQRKLESLKYAKEIDARWLATGLLLEASKEYSFGNNRDNFLQPWPLYPHDQYIGRPNYPPKITEMFPF